MYDHHDMYVSRRQRPWVPVHFLRVKGVALALLKAESFAEFTESAALRASEGSLLRYFADVYRALRLGVPKALKTPRISQDRSINMIY